MATKNTTSSKTKGASGTKQKSNVGRKPSWNVIVENLETIEKLLKEGYTERSVASYIGIGYSTWNKYKSIDDEDMPKSLKTEFIETIKRGRQGLVGELKKALIKKAMGFTYTEKKYYITEDEDGNKKKHTEVYERQALPDTASLNLALKNYDDEWANDPALLELKRQAFELEKMIASEKNWINLDEIDKRLEGKNE